jgi:uncharacterized protein YqfA (UPF0365 family)
MKFKRIGFNVAKTVVVIIGIFGLLINSQFLISESKLLCDNDNNTNLISNYIITNQLANGSTYQILSIKEQQLNTEHNLKQCQITYSDAKNEQTTLIYSIGINNNQIELIDVKPENLNI